MIGSASSNKRVPRQAGGHERIFSAEVDSRGRSTEIRGRSMAPGWNWSNGLDSMVLVFISCLTGNQGREPHRDDGFHRRCFRFVLPFSQRRGRGFRSPDAVRPGGEVFVDG